MLCLFRTDRSVQSQSSVRPNNIFDVSVLDGYQCANDHRVLLRPNWQRCQHVRPLKVSTQHPGFLLPLIILSSDRFNVLIDSQEMYEKLLQQHSHRPQHLWQVINFSSCSPIEFYVKMFFKSFKCKFIPCQHFYFPSQQSKISIPRSRSRPKISMCPRSHKLYFLDILLFSYLQNIFSDPVFLILFLNVGEKIIPVLQMLNPLK